MAIDVARKALQAMKTDPEDSLTRLKAIERYIDLAELAQGKLVAKPVDTTRPQMTWEEFAEMYRRRKSHPEKSTEPAEPSPTAD